LPRGNAKRDEAQAREAALAEVLQVINSSPDDLAPVFDAMLDRALALCGAAFGSLWIYDGERVHAVALRGHPPDSAKFLQGTAHPVDHNAHGRLLRGEPVVHIADVADDEAYRAGDPLRRNLVELTGGRTLLAVPLWKEGRFLGDFVIYRREVRPFLDKEITLLENFAAQAVIAMENARLLGELRQRTGDLEEALEQQTATAAVLGVINSSPGDLAPVFDAILEKAHSLCGIAFGSLLIRDGEEFCVVAAREQDNDPNGGSGYIKVRREQDRFRPPEDTPLWRVAVGERLVHLADATVDDSYHHAPAYARLIDAGGVRTLLLVPLRKR
jgi:transcriptional regulator with GAF, ATPase, and Fis domain